MADGVWTPTPDRLNDCRQEIARLVASVNDLEALADAESGGSNRTMAAVGLAKLARDAVRPFELELMRKRLEYSVEGDASARGDKSRLGQVLANLLSNAVKYTLGSGLIRALLRRESAWAFAEILDDGIGILRTR